MTIELKSCFFLISFFFIPQFLWLTFLVSLSAILNAPVKPLMDSAVLSILSDKADYGKSRLFGQMGFGIGAYIGGLFIGKDLKNMFITHAGIHDIISYHIIRYTLHITSVINLNVDFFNSYRPLLQSYLYSQPS